MQWIDAIISQKTLSIEIKAYCTLLIENGLRISELLSINLSKTSANGLILIHGSKGSNDRFVRSVNYNEFFVLSRNRNFTIGSLYSRFFFYRLFKSLGIVSFSSVGGNDFVTHSGREVLIKSMYANANSVINIKNYIGHKNEKSTNIYITKKTK
jgi:integrase